MHMNFFKHIHSLEIKIAKLEQELERVKQSTKKQIELTRNQLVLSKQGAPILDWTILKGYTYTDLSPAMALEYYNNPNIIYKVLDVTKADFRPDHQFDHYVKIPLEELTERYKELEGTKGLLFVISEEGLRSILACEKLANLGLYNCFNISGGYSYFPKEEEQKKSA